MGILDATTLELDEAASAPFLGTNWMSPLRGSGIYALAVPSGDAPTAAVTRQSASIAAATAGRLVMGGVIPRWKLRVAGNVVRTTVGADTTAPTVSAIRVAPRVGQALSPGKVPVRVTWAGADPHGSGVASYEVGMSTSGGAYVSLGSNVLAPAVNVTLSTGKSYRFRARPTDYAGNVGTWSYGPTVTDVVKQQSKKAIRYSSGWKIANGSGFLGGSVKYHRAVGATATYTFTGRGVGLVTTFGPGRGRVKVYVDGRYQKTVDLAAKTNRFRVVAWSKTWTTTGKHTVKLVLKGPSSRPRVDLDAFVLIR